MTDDSMPSVRDPAAGIHAANAELAADNLDAARATLLDVLRTAPDSAPAHNLLGFIALREGKFTDAQACFQRAIALEPANGIYRENLALTQSMPRGGSEPGTLHAVLAADPARPELWRALAEEQVRTRGAAAAVPVLYEALSYCAEDGRLLHLLANILHQLGRLAEALTHYHHALRVDPEAVDLRVDLSSAYQSLLRIDAAERLAREAHQRAPDSPRTNLALGSVLYQRHRFRDAIRQFEHALARAPDDSRAHNQLGMSYTALGEANQALACFRRAIDLRPDYRIARSNLLLAMIYSESATRADIHAEAVQQGAADGPARSARHANTPVPERRLRVGFISGDFRRHVVGTFILPLFARHDRKLLEIFCYSTVDVPDPFTQLLRGHAAGWADVRRFDDAALAARISADQVDVLVDLAGHTGANRLPVFALRPAPVQVTWLGFVGTTGAPGVDYRFSDRVLDPPGTEAWSTETVVRLENGYFCYAPIPDMGGALPVTDSPARRTGRITFGAFNNLAKVNPACFEVWAEVLRRVPGAALVSRAKAFEDPGEKARFVAQFARRGVDASRIRPIEYFPDPKKHLEIYNEVDIHLDSMPCTGGTTNCDSLWMGVPVVTLAGDRASARLGATVMTHAGLGDLIATSAEGYARTAAGLARDVDRLAAMRAGMRARFTSSLLHDADGFARAFEHACRGLWRAWCERPAPS